LVAGVGLEEAAGQMVVPAAVVPVHAQVVLLGVSPLTGVTIVCLLVVHAVAGLAKRVIAQSGVCVQTVAAGCGCQCRRTQTAQAFEKAHGLRSLSQPGCPFGGGGGSIGFGY